MKLSGQKKCWVRFLAAVLCCMIVFGMVPAVAAESASSDFEWVVEIPETEDAMELPEEPAEEEPEQAEEPVYVDREPEPDWDVDPLGLISETAVLMEAETGQILYEKNMHQQMYPASITKIMTGMLTLLNLQPDQVLTVTKSAVDAVPWSSSQIFLEPGEELTVEQLLCALAMESANDAANVLAEGVSGDLEAFARKMTEAAWEAGAYNTQFRNANGLPDSEHYTTAFDMAMIMAAALKVPGFTDFFCRRSYDCAPTNRYGDTRRFLNRNQMIAERTFYPGVIASKTGWTSSAQGTLVTAVRRDDTTLIAVTMKSPRTEDKYRDSRLLLDYGFSGFERCAVPGEALGAQIELEGYEPAAGQEFSMLLPQGYGPENVTYKLVKTLISGKDSAIAAVEAEVDGVRLPDIALLLTPLPEEPEETEPAAAPAMAAVPVVQEITDLMNLAEPEAPAKPWVLWCVAGVFVFAAAVVQIHRQRVSRRQRRNRLASRIRQMKKKMEQ